MRISAIRQAVLFCWPEVKNSSADAKACDGNPTDFNMPCNAPRIKSSSSTIATKFVLPGLAMVQKVAAPSEVHNHTLVCECSYHPRTFGSLREPHPTPCLTERSSRMRNPERNSV